MIDYVNAAIREHREPQDQVGVIVFGREPAIEIPPFDDNVQVPKQIESQLDPDYTNIAAAIKLAEAAFPHDAAKRMVLVSDGNQNLGDALEEARGAVEAGIGIDVLPVRYGSRSEIIVEKIALPPDVRKGQPFDLRIVVNNTNPPESGEQATVGGRLRVSSAPATSRSSSRASTSICRRGKASLPCGKRSTSPTSIPTRRNSSLTIRPPTRCRRTIAPRRSRTCAAAAMCC